MNQTTLLEKFIHGVVEEAMIEMAKQPHEAEASGFALSNWKSGNTAYLVLYEPAKLVEICQEMVRQPEQLGFDAKLAAVSAEYNNPVVGYIRMMSSDCGWVIKNSVANKGYGPMMYDIALSYAGKTGVVPDRVEGVSPSARNIWKYYITKRKGEVRAYPFSQDDECATFTDDEDSWFLDVKYILRNSDLGKVQNLISKGDQAFEQIHQVTQGAINPSEALRRLASSFFDLNYQPS